MEEKLDSVKRMIAKKSAQIRADQEWVRDVKIAIRKHKKKMELVSKNADEVRENIKRLFGMKAKYEAMLVKYRLGDDIKSQAESSEESSNTESSLESSHAESSSEASESSKESSSSSSMESSAKQPASEQSQAQPQAQPQPQAQKPASL